MPSHAAALVFAGALACMAAGPGARAEGRSLPDTRALTEVQAAFARGDAAAALQRAQRALEAAPHDAQLLFQRALAQLELGRDVEALTGFEALHQRFPELPEPLNNIALLQARSGRLDEARLSLEAALRNDPGHRPSRLNLAELHLMLALRHWEHAAAATPLEPRLQQRLAAVRALAGVGPPAAR